MDVLLSGNKGVALPQLHNELLQVVDDTCLKFRLCKRHLLWKTEEFGNYRILDKFHLVLQWSGFLNHFLVHQLFVLRYQHSMVVLAADVTLQCPCAPHLVGSLTFIPIASFLASLLENNAIVCPGKANG